MFLFCTEGFINIYCKGGGMRH